MLSEIKNLSISPELIDLRILNPINISKIVESVKNTKTLLVIDGGWKNCGISSEVITSVVESKLLDDFKIKVKRLTLPDSPAPTSNVLEKDYYPNNQKVIKSIIELIS